MKSSKIELITFLNHWFIEEKLKTFSNLEFYILSQELQLVVVSLKNNKAVGLDSISNDMLKCGFSQLKNCFMKFFTNGSYPSNHNFHQFIKVEPGVTLIFIGEISILPCAAKLFNTILTNHLDEFFFKDNAR